VLVFMASNDNAATQKVMDELIDYQVDGIIVASVGVSNDLTSRCEDAGIPIVLFNRDQFDDRLSSVTSDNMRGGRKLAEFLIAGGHDRIGHIAGWEGASTQIDREAGFKAGLMDAGIKMAVRTVGNFHFETSKEAARSMFDRDDPPDAVFVANDHMAFAVMDVLRSELGMSVPDDVSVVGYDDVQIAAWAAYDLTTVRQRANAMVAETIDILMSRLDDRNTPARRVCIDGPLIIRGSARLPQGI
jgi:DNA-binding LacI/PurR family transcriptional regulator